MEDVTSHRNISPDSGISSDRALKCLLQIVICQNKKISLLEAKLRHFQNEAKEKSKSGCHDFQQCSFPLRRCHSLPHRHISPQSQSCQDISTAEITGLRDLFVENSLPQFLDSSYKQDSSKDNFYQKIKKKGGGLKSRNLNQTDSDCQRDDKIDFLHEGLEDDGSQAYTQNKDEAVIRETNVDPKFMPIPKPTADIPVTSLDYRSMFRKFMSEDFQLIPLKNNSLDLEEQTSSPQQAIPDLMQNIPNFNEIFCESEQDRLSFADVVNVINDSCRKWNNSLSFIDNQSDRDNFNRDDQHMRGTLEDIANFRDDRKLLVKCDFEIRNDENSVRHVKEVASSSSYPNGEVSPPLSSVISKVAFDRLAKEVAKLKADNLFLKDFIVELLKINAVSAEAELKRKVEDLEKRHVCEKRKKDDLMDMLKERKRKIEALENTTADLQLTIDTESRRSREESVRTQIANQKAQEECCRADRVVEMLNDERKRFARDIHALNDKLKRKLCKSCNQNISTSKKTQHTQQESNP